MNDEQQFLNALQSSLEIFVNRMKSNSARGRSIANDSSVQTLFMTINAMHPQLMKHIGEQEDARGKSLILGRAAFSQQSGHAFQVAVAIVAVMAGRQGCEVALVNKRTRALISVEAVRAYPLALFRRQSQVCLVLPLFWNTHPRSWRPQWVQRRYESLLLGRAVATVSLALWSLLETASSTPEQKKTTASPQ